MFVSHCCYPSCQLWLISLSLTIFSLSSCYCFISHHIAFSFCLFFRLHLTLSFHFTSSHFLLFLFMSSMFFPFYCLSLLFLSFPFLISSSLLIHVFFILHLLFLSDPSCFLPMKWCGITFKHNLVGVLYHLSLLHFFLFHSHYFIFYFVIPLWVTKLIIIIFFPLLPISSPLFSYFYVNPFYCCLLFLFFTISFSLCYICCCLCCV